MNSKEIRKAVAQVTKQNKRFADALPSNRKGQAMNAAIAGVIGLVVLGIVLSIGGTILGDVYTSTTSARAQNLTNASLSGLDKFGNLVPTLALVVIAAVVLSLVVGAFRQAT